MEHAAQATLGVALRLHELALEAIFRIVAERPCVYPPDHLLIGRRAFPAWYRVGFWDQEAGDAIAIRRGRWPRDRLGRA